MLRCRPFVVFRNPIFAVKDNHMIPIVEFKKILGRDFVFDDDETLSKYERATLPKGTRAAAVLMPENDGEIQKIVKIANGEGLKLYPISRGRNWGYGSACPVGDGQIILDLSRMNRILHVDETLAYAVIEPGVTQIQLVSYLKENDLPLWLDCTGSGPDASIVGNTLERGFGHTPYGDHLLHTCGMEIILGDGRTLKTGFGHFHNSQATQAFKYGIGPYMDGLFTQSNFGIVTRLGIWLMPEPEAVNMFYCAVPKEEDLSPVVEALRPLKLNGQVKSLIHIGNDLRVISSFNQYPWEQAKHQTPLSDDLRDLFCKKGKFGAWNVSGAIYGSKGQVRITRRELKKALGHLGKINFIGDRGVNMVNRLSKVLDRFSILQELNTRFKSLDKVYGLLKGQPTDAFLFGSLWRVKRPMEGQAISNPLDYNAGMMWIGPIMPMTGQAAQTLNAAVKPVFDKYAFEPLMTISLITERAMVCIITISYDRENLEETQRAEQCYNEFFDLIMSMGYIPYRTNIHSMKKLADHSETFWQVTKDIKSALDPNGIISPGRYQPLDPT